MDPADEGQSEASATATNVVWVFRIVLPIFLFILWHRLQAPTGTGGKCCYPRDTVMAARQPPAKSMDEAPECLQGLRLVDEGTAQRLLGLPPPRVSSSSAGGGRREARGPRQRGGRGGNEGRRSEEWLEADLMDDAHVHADSAHGFPQENGKGHAQGQGQGQGDTAPAPAATIAAVSAEDLAARSALLAGLALGHGRPQRRSFLHDELRPPPPPPPSARQAQALAGQAPDAAAIVRMNAEARTVLRGLLSLRQAVLTPLPAASASPSASAAGAAGVANGPRWTEVPRRVQRQLQEAMVLADAATFTLLVEASASLADLPAASDFLMKMENAGHCAGNELLDMVMDLYAGGSSGAGSNGAPPGPGPGRVGAGRDKLDRFLSKAGVLSRQEARFAVRRGSVQVNGQLVRDPWELVRPGHDLVEVDGIGEVQLPDWSAKPPTVVLYNKPPDVVVTLRSDDPTMHGQQRPLHESLPPPWRDLMAPHVPALRPVGRLDALSVGLLLLTDSSGLAAKLMAPGSCEKEYVLRVQPVPEASTIEALASGLEINDGNFARGPTRPCDVSLVEKDEKSAVLCFRIQEGRNRQLRRMCTAVGLKVVWLLRLRVGPVRLGDLPVGEAREATAAELEALLAVAEDEANR